MTGILGSEWIWKDFTSFEGVANSARLSSYVRNSEHLSSEKRQVFLDQVEAGKIGAASWAFEKLETTFCVGPIESEVTKTSVRVTSV